MRSVVQRPPRTSNECWRTTYARKMLWQKIINFQYVGGASTMCDWAIRSENNTKMLTLSTHITPIQRVPNAFPANIYRIWGVLNAFWLICASRWQCAVYLLTLSPCYCTMLWLNSVYSLIYTPDLFITRCIFVLNSLALLMSWQNS